jgi:hypothetical protein
MPDTWELANGLNPNFAADARTLAASGYSNIELYFNGLVAVPEPAGLTMAAGMMSALSRRRRS